MQRQKQAGSLKRAEVIRFRWRGFEDKYLFWHPAHCEAPKRAVGKHPTVRVQFAWSPISHQFPFHAGVKVLRCRILAPLALFMDDRAPVFVGH